MDVHLEDQDSADLLVEGLSAALDPESAERLAAAWSLNPARRGADGSLLVRWLGEGPPSTRAAVATALGLLGEESAAEPLACLLADDALEVRRAAALALCRIGDPRSGAALLGVLEAMSLDPDPGERAMAARALRMLPAPEAFVLLEALCDDPDPGVRADASDAIREMGS